MDTWIECAWFQCRKRFEPSKYNNQYYRADARYHADAKFCSGACKQKAYRLRRKLDAAPVTREAKGINTHAPVTHTKDIIETKQEFWTKIEHGRSVIQLPDGCVCSDWKPCLSSDHATLPDLPIPDFLMRIA